MTETQLVTAVADRAEMSKADAKRAVAALDEIVLAESGTRRRCGSAASCS